MNFDYLFGYVDGKRIIVKNTVQQVVAFIMRYKNSETTITSPLDQFILSTTVGGFIMKCPDQAFLIEKLLPALVPVQRGEKRAPRFIMVNEI